MYEVSGQTVALVLDACRQRGLDTDALLRAVHLDPTQVAAPRARIDWEDWVALLEQTERLVGSPTAMTTLFVPGAGRRTGHLFVRIANTFLSLRDVYALFGRWGLLGTLRVVEAEVSGPVARSLRFQATITAPLGSAPTLRFIAGVLRALPTLQGLPTASVHVRPGLTDHHAVYDVLLPEEPSGLARARRLVSVATGAAATLEALEAQAAEIAEKNAELQRQLAELEVTTQTLHERERWLDLALEAGRIAIFRWTASDRRIRWLTGSPRALGLEGDFAYAEDWRAAIHPDDRARVREEFAEAARAGSGFELEYRVQTRGGVVWIRSKGQVLRDPDGSPREATGTHTDVTERRALEARLRHADRIVAAGTLAAGVAHEINNPLTYVIGNLELLREQARVEGALAPLAEPFADMADGLDRIRRVVRDLRTFARPEEDRIDLVNLREVCEAALRLVRPAVRHRAVVQTDHATEPVFAKASDARLGQVVVNLVVNAMQAMPPRPASDSVIVVRTRATEGQAILEVEDNGTGIDPKLLPRLFEPFFSTRSAGANSGLGLSVCQTIVAGFGGRIDVDTALGRGTSVRVSLPLAQQTAPVSRPSRAAAPTTPARVLVVDDEPLVRKALLQLLSRAGHVTAEAEGGEEALRCIATHPYDVIVCDLMMPGVSGVEVHATLSRAAPDMVRRILFVSGGAVTEETRAFVERPDIVVLGKPFDPAVVLTTIEEVVRREGRHERAG